MKKLTVALLVLSLASTALYAAEASITLTEEQLTSLGVKLGKPQAVHEAPLLNAPAQVVVPPAHEYIVSAAQAGLITKLNAAAGDSVTKGQTLAKINSPELLMLQKQYLQAISESRLAWITYQRDKKLHDAGLIAERRWQEASTQFNLQTSAENEAKQLLAIAGMSDGDIKRLAATRRLESQFEARSPADAVVLERMVQTGERVAAQAPLFRIANLDELWLEIAIPQQRVREIKTGDRITLENSKATAHITLLGQSVNPQTQTVVGRALIDAEHDLRVGQTVNAQIFQTSSETLFKLPDSAVALNAGQAYIFSRNVAGFTVKAVRIVGKQGGFSYVGDALRADESIAVNGAAALKANWLGLGRGEE